MRLAGALFVPDLLEKSPAAPTAANRRPPIYLPRGIRLHDEPGRAFMMRWLAEGH